MSEGEIPMHDTKNTHAAARQTESRELQRNYCFILWNGN